MQIQTMTPIEAFNHLFVEYIERFGVTAEGCTKAQLTHLALECLMKLTVPEDEWPALKAKINGMRQ